jgi:hypothetical protein
VALVIPFEDIFLGDVSEDCNCFVQNTVDFGIRFLERYECIFSNVKTDRLTPFSPLLRLSSINNEINSDDFSFRLIKDSKAFGDPTRSVFHTTDSGK